MIAKLSKIVFFAVSVVFIIYLSLPGPRFPNALPGSYQSKEPADLETPLRRGYFTNLKREEVIKFYGKEFGWGFWLNYPPEESQTLIRDQTKSTYLMEIVHPFRESLFVSGLEVKVPGEEFVKEGKPWTQKVIIKYVGSNVFGRIAISLLTISAAWLLIKEWVNA